MPNVLATDNDNVDRLCLGPVCVAVIIIIIIVIIIIIIMIHSMGSMHDRSKHNFPDTWHCIKSYLKQ